MSAPAGCSPGRDRIQREQLEGKPGCTCGEAVRLWLCGSGAQAAPDVLWVCIHVFTKLCIPVFTRLYPWPLMSMKCRGWNPQLLLFKETQTILCCPCCPALQTQPRLSKVNTWLLIWHPEYPFEWKNPPWSLCSRSLWLPLSQPVGTAAARCDLCGDTALRRLPVGWQVGLVLSRGWSQGAGQGWE